MIATTAPTCATCGAPTLPDGACSADTSHARPTPAAPRRIGYPDPQYRDHPLTFYRPLPATPIGALVDAIAAVPGGIAELAAELAARPGGADAMRVALAATSRSGPKGKVP